MLCLMVQTTKQKTISTEINKVDNGIELEAKLSRHSRMHLTIRVYLLSIDTTFFLYFINRTDNG